MGHLYVSVLGTYKAELDTVPLSGFDSDKTRLLLAYLVVESGKVQRREQLVGLFWPEQPEAAARRSLSQALYNLRQLLEKNLGAGDSFLSADGLTVQFNPKSSYILDISLFKDLVTACERHNHRYLEACPECLSRLEDAVGLYRGDFLSGFTFKDSAALEEWALVQREHLHRQALLLLKSLAQSYENRGEISKAVEVTRRQIEIDSFWEAGQRRLMRLLALEGQYSQALAQYESYKQLLAKELAISPEQETLGLAEQIQRKVELEPVRTNLPIPIFPLVGRKEELADLHCYLHDPSCRLLTILGPGGCGKTRLALEEAYRQRYQFKDGVFFIPLSALTTGSSLLAVIAEGVGFTVEFGGQKKQLLDFLRHKQVLLVLDSFETVVESAGLVADILAASQASKVLLTSRVQLSLSGEQVYPLEGMQVPPPEIVEGVSGYSAAELFLDAARRVRPGYKPDSLVGVAKICQVVEGMPLSLLLASTWVSDYPAQEIAVQISRSLDFLSVEWADLPERQRSLRATFEYSWSKLPPNEQLILANISVFRDPFNLQAAEQVAGASPTLVHSLVSKSLLMSLGEGQYKMHDLVRQFSGEKLANTSSMHEQNIRLRHSDYFLEMALEWSKLFKSSKQSPTLAQADKKVDDVQSAWVWASQEADMESIARASEGLCLYYELRYRYQEGENACILALEGLKEKVADGEGLALKCLLLAWQTKFCQRMGMLEKTMQLRESCLQDLNLAEATGQDVRRGRALLLSEDYYLVRSIKDRLYSLQQSAELFASVDEPWWQGWVLGYAGQSAGYLGDSALAMKLKQDAVVMSQKAGEPFRLFISQMFLAYHYLEFSPWETGVRLMEEAASSYASVGDPLFQARPKIHLACSFGFAGRFAEACAMMEPIIDQIQQLGIRFLVAHATAYLGLFQIGAGRYKQAFNTLQECLTITQQDGFLNFELDSLYGLGELAILEGNPQQAVNILQPSSSRCRQIRAEYMLGLTLGRMALAQHLLGREAEARDSLLESLHLAIKTRDRYILFSLPDSLVVMLADAGMWEEAVEAYAAVVVDPFPANSRAFADMVGNRMELAREKLGEEVYRAAEARGQEGDLYDMFSKLEQELTPVAQ